MSRENLLPVLILASASPRRFQLLKDHFKIIRFSRSIDENVGRGEIPKLYVRRMALEKWQSAQRSWTRKVHYPLLSADTTVVCEGRILGKPSSRSDAAKMLRRLSNRTHWVHTSFAIGWSSETRPMIMKTVSSRIRFRQLSSQELDQYLSSNEWRGKAGAYGIQGAALNFVDGIWGSLTSVVGLPVNESLQGVAQVLAHPPALKP